MNTFTVTYEGKEIVFSHDQFNYDGGRYVNADFTKVKEYIDREIKANFERFEVWNQRGDIVTLTSNPSPNVYWGMCDGNRAKYEAYRSSGFNLFLKNEKNAIAVEKIKSLNESINDLQKRVSEMRKEQERLIQSMDRLPTQEARNESNI